MEARSNIHNIWHRPKLYFTIVSVYLIFVGVSAVIFPTIEHSRNSGSGGGIDLFNLYLIIALSYLMINVLAVILLLSESENIILAISMLILTIIALLFILGPALDAVQHGSSDPVIRATGVWGIPVLALAVFMFYLLSLGRRGLDEIKHSREN